ncbi:hypothetical protein GCM10009123_14730 [Kangiella japonica]|uniref:Thiol:disulfide interchange protein DsbA n=1 Tax=Kangiella japonica TaxID=647384 RepID=A0ABN0T0D2_9GAMM
MNLKAITVSLVAFALLALTACSEDGAKETKSQATQETVVTKKEEAKVNEPVKIELKEGVDYIEYANLEASEEPLVYEFFSYTCPHCYNLEPIMIEWKRNYKAEEVKFKQIPVFLPQVPHLTYGFYTAEELGVLEEYHLSMFAEWHENNNRIIDKAGLVPLFESIGVSKEKFEEVYASEDVEKKVEEAKALIGKFQVTSFPLLIINEKYKVNSYDNLQQLLGSFAITNTKKS